MKKILFVLTLLIVISCSKPEKTVLKDPFKSGDVAYMKLDSTKVVIKMQLGLADENNFAYVISYKENGEVKTKWFTLSSELIK